MNRFVSNCNNVLRILLLDYPKANLIPNTIRVNERIIEGIVIMRLTIQFIIQKNIY